MAEPTAYAVPHLNPSAVASYATAHPVIAVAGAALALTAVVVTVRAIRRTARRLIHGRKPEDILTIVVATIATGVVGTGMWKFATDVLHFPIWLRVLLFGFIEMATVTSAVRARRAMQEEAAKAAADPSYEPRGAGPDGVAVWVLTSASAVLSTIDANGFAEGVFRLIAPLISAWLWERGMSAERERITGRSDIHWRITPERILVWLGVAEPTVRTAGDVDVHRRLHRLARAAKRLRVLQLTGAADWRQRRALRRLDAAMARAVEHADLATDSGRQEQLLAQLGALYGAAALAEVTPRVPWATAPRPPAPRVRSLHRVPRSAEVRDAEIELCADLNLPFETPDRLSAWLDEGRVPGDDDPVPDDERPVPDADDHQAKAARIFAEEVQAGKVPGIRPIKKRLGIAQPKAQEVQTYLKALVNQ
ncbi:hypothetical protein [Actinomadura sp. DC4]|uniref:hypothetical protein n=1 Tax=Actinomadura sp. DC4 TaxID=3055069 RepID=UPI0025B0750F|nr:hypothetical protein [Actinomadura sp. DC4]MDN3356112.1 hypothetical protein [Actinomadura sp. DC4]